MAYGLIRDRTKNRYPARQCPGMALLPCLNAAHCHNRHHVAATKFKVAMYRGTLLAILDTAIPAVLVEHDGS